MIANSGRVASLALTVLAVACSPGGSGPSRAEAENEIAIRSLLAMVGSGNGDEVAGLFLPDAVYDDYANQQQYRGLEEIAGYISGGTRWATAVNVDILSLHLSDSVAVAEWVFTGIQDHTIGSFLPVATGREVVLNGVTIIEMEDGRIRRASDYVDALALVLQLGGEVHMPGGGLLRQDTPAAPAEPDTLPSPPEPS
jgi:steroid delta-isomerase-like uncharacterized protein